MVPLRIAGTYIVEENPSAVLSCRCCRPGRAEPALGQSLRRQGLRWRQPAAVLPLRCLPGSLRPAAGQRGSAGCVLSCWEGGMLYCTSTSCDHTDAWSGKILCTKNMMCSRACIPRLLERVLPATHVHSPAERAWRILADRQSREAAARLCRHQRAARCRKRTLRSRHRGPAATEAFRTKCRL